MDETEPIPAALLAEALLLAADDHHRRLGVRLTDLMPPVVLAAPAEIRAAAVDGARLRAGTSPGRAGPLPGSRRPRRPRALGETRGEILEPRLGVGGGGGGGGRAREGQHGRAGVRRRRAPRRSPGSRCPFHAAGQRNASALLPTKKPSRQRGQFQEKILCNCKKQTTSQEKSIHARRPTRYPRTPPILALPRQKNARAAHGAKSKAAIQVQAKQKGMRQTGGARHIRSEKDDSAAAAAPPQQQPAAL